jgi:hypothetical protein
VQRYILAAVLVAFPLAAQAQVTSVTETICKRTKRYYACETRSETRIPKPKPVAAPPRPYVPGTDRIEEFGVRVMRGGP